MAINTETTTAKLLGEYSGSPQNSNQLIDVKLEQKIACSTSSCLESP